MSYYDDGVCDLIRAELKELDRLCAALNWLFPEPMRARAAKMEADIRATLDAMTAEREKEAIRAALLAMPDEERRGA